MRDPCRSIPPGIVEAQAVFAHAWIYAPTPGRCMHDQLKVVSFIASPLCGWDPRSMRDAQPIAVTAPMQIGAGQIGHTLSGRSQPRSRTPIATIRDTETAIFTQFRRRGWPRNAFVLFESLP
jgi:hypothetical protein